MSWYYSSDEEETGFYGDENNEIDENIDLINELIRDINNKYNELQEITKKLDKYIKENIDDMDINYVKRMIRIFEEMYDDVKDTDINQINFSISFLENEDNNEFKSKKKHLDYFSTLKDWKKKVSDMNMKLKLLLMKFLGLFSKQQFKENASLESTIYKFRNRVLPTERKTFKITNESKLRQEWEEGNYEKFERIIPEEAQLTNEEMKQPKYQREMRLIEKQNKINDVINKINLERDELVLKMSEMDIEKMLIGYNEIVNRVINKVSKIRFEEDTEIMFAKIQEIYNYDFKELRKLLDKYYGLKQMLMDRFGDEMVNKLLERYNIEEQYVEKTSFMLMNIRNKFEELTNNGLLLPGKFDSTLQKIFKYFDDIGIEDLHLDINIERVYENRMSDEELIDLIRSFRYTGLDNESIRIILEDEPYYLDNERFNEIIRLI